MLGGPDAPTVAPEPVTGTQTTLFRSSISTTHGTVNTSAIVWSPVVARLKSQLCYDQTNKSAVAGVNYLGRPATTILAGGGGGID